MVDLLLGSSILSTVIALTTQLSNNSFNQASNTNQRSKVNEAITSRIEELREASFLHLCEKSQAIGKENECRPNHISQPRYDLKAVNKYCKSNSLGISLLRELKNHEGNLADNFNLTDYDKKAQSELIYTEFKALGGQIHVSFNSDKHNQISTIIVPSAHKYCA